VGYRELHPGELAMSPVGCVLYMSPEIAVGKHTNKVRYSGVFSRLWHPPLESKSVTHDFLRNINILTYLLTYLKNKNPYYF